MGFYSFVYVCVCLKACVCMLCVGGTDGMYCTSSAGPSPRWRVPPACARALLLPFAMSANGPLDEPPSVEVLRLDDAGAQPVELKEELDGQAEFESLRASMTTQTDEPEISQKPKISSCWSGCFGGGGNSSWKGSSARASTPPAGTNADQTNDKKEN